MTPPEKRMRGRAKVETRIVVTHMEEIGILGVELASARLENEAVLDRGDGSLLDNERTFRALLEEVTRETEEKVEATLSDQWTEREDEARNERREEQLSEAQLFISRADTPNERGQRAKVLSEFLGTTPEELTAG